MNNSVMKCCICNNEKIGEFITINDKKYHLCCIEQLQQENEKNNHYKTLYQSLKKQKEELRDWLENDKDKITVLDTKDNSSVRLGIMLGMGLCLDKLEELEGVSNE